MCRGRFAKVEVRRGRFARVAKKLVQEIEVRFSGSRKVKVHIDRFSKVARPGFSNNLVGKFGQEVTANDVLAGPAGNCLRKAF